MSLTQPGAPSRRHLENVRAEARGYGMSDATFEALVAEVLEEARGMLHTDDRDRVKMLRGRVRAWAGR